MKFKIGDKVRAALRKGNPHLKWDNKYSEFAELRGVATIIGGKDNYWNLDIGGWWSNEELEHASKLKPIIVMRGYNEKPNKK